MKKPLLTIVSRGLDFMELLSRIELLTSSLPRTRSAN